MCHADNEKGEKRNNGWNRTTKSGKNQKLLEKKKIKIENLRSGDHQTNNDERKKTMEPFFQGSIVSCGDLSKKKKKSEDVEVESCLWVSILIK